MRRWAAGAASLASIACACAVVSCRPIDLVAVPNERDDGGSGRGGAAAGAGAGAGGADASTPEPAGSGGAGNPGDAGLDADTGPDAGAIDPGVCIEEPFPPELREGDLPAALVVAAPQFPSAVCSCGAYVGRAALVTDVWNGGAGGDVMLNDDEINLEADSAIAGSLIAAGTGVILTGDIELGIGGNLAVNGALNGALAALRVGGNAAVGDAIVLTDLSVSGTLTQPQGAMFDVSGTSDLGAQQSGAVQIAAPCPCAPNQLTDVAAIVEAALPATVPAAPHACPWPAAGSPPRALFLEGDLAVDGDLVIGAGSGEDIALLVEGNVLVTGRIELGSAAHGRRVHLYVGGTGTVQLSSGTLVGAIYAPNAVLVLREPVTVYGAVLAARISAESSLTVHDDPTLR